MLAHFALKELSGNLGALHERFELLTGDDRDVRAVDTHYCVAASDIAKSDQWLIAIDGKPRKNSIPVSASDLLATIGHDVDALISALSGEFALVAYDVTSGQLVAAVDRMGISRITWQSTTTGTTVGSSAVSVRKLSGVSASIRAQGLYDFLFFHMVPSPATIFDGIYKIPPAHFVRFADGKSDSRRYWAPQFAVHDDKSERGQTNQLREALDSSVRRHSSDALTGAFLSGGIDSSTVAGYLSRNANENAQSFSIGFGVEEFNELEYARIAASHFSLESHEYNVTAADVVDVFSDVAMAFDEPFGNSSVIPTLYCAKLAKSQGIERLLAGDGGDELFGGNERYAKHKLFESYQRVPAWLREYVVEPATNRIPDDSPLFLLRKSKRFVEQAIVPLPDRLGINIAFSIGLGSKLSDDFRDSIDVDGPLQQMRETFKQTQSGAVVNDMMAYDWKLTLADNDLRKVGTMCRLAGIDVAYPLLDDEIVELSTKVTAGRKLRRLRLRSFFKDSMKGFLPDSILQKTKHGFGLPFGVWLKTDSNLRDLVIANLERLDERGLFQRGFVNEIMRDHADGPANFFGYFIWDLAMLEQWLRHHE